MDLFQLFVPAASFNSPAIKDDLEKMNINELRPTFYSKLI